MGYENDKKASRGVGAQKGRAESVSRCVELLADSIEAGESLDISGMCKYFGYGWHDEVRPYVEENPAAQSRLLNALQGLKYRMINRAYKMSKGEDNLKANALTPLRWVIALIDDESLLGLSKQKKNTRSDAAVKEFLERMVATDESTS